MAQPDLIQAADLFGQEIGHYGRRLLAEGDSWFTLGSLNLQTNLLQMQAFRQSTVIVSCAYPGDTLRHMAEATADREFNRLLWQPRYQRYWEALLLSCGGNDLIDAAQSPPTDANGQPTPLAQRLLQTEAEAAASPADGAMKYLSEPGWATLAGYLQQSLAAIVALRDKGDSRGRPLILHTYAVPTVRPAGTLGASKGWLYPAMQAFRIPRDQQQAVAALLFERLRQLWLAQPATLPHVHVFDSAALPDIQPAAPDATGISGDWDNEIHLTRTGYGKIGKQMGPWIEALLATYP